MEADKWIRSDTERELESLVKKFKAEQTKRLFLCGVCESPISGQEYIFYYNDDKNVACTECALSFMKESQSEAFLAWVLAKEIQESE